MLCCFDVLIPQISFILKHKKLVECRKEFQKLGKDLEHAKDRDMERYNNVLEQLKESYRQCGTVCSIPNSLVHFCPICWIFLNDSANDAFAWSNVSFIRPIITFTCEMNLQRHKRLKKIFVVLHEELKVIYFIDSQFSTYRQYHLCLLDWLLYFIQLTVYPSSLCSTLSKGLKILHFLIQEIEEWILLSRIRSVPTSTSTAWMCMHYSCSATEIVIPFNMYIQISFLYIYIWGSTFGSGFLFLFSLTLCYFFGFLTFLPITVSHLSIYLGQSQERVRKGKRGLFVGVICDLYIFLESESCWYFCPLTKNPIMDFVFSSFINVTTVILCRNVESH